MAAWSHLRADQLELSPLVTQGPLAHLVTACPGVAREQPGAPLRGADADLPAQLLGVAFQNGHRTPPSTRWRSARSFVIPVNIVASRFGNRSALRP